MGSARKWFPQPEISWPCYDISYSAAADAPLKVVMHFSKVDRGFDKDLELAFKDPLAMCCESESFPVIPPDDLPFCSGEWSVYVHPTLIIEESSWAEPYRLAANSLGVGGDATHYLLMSFDQILHVATQQDPQRRWIPPAGNNTRTWMRSSERER